MEGSIDESGGGGGGSGNGRGRGKLEVVAGGVGSGAEEMTGGEDAFFLECVVLRAQAKFSIRFRNYREHQQNVTYGFRT